MKKLIFSVLYLSGLQALAQPDTINIASVTVHKDFRLDILARKEADINAVTIKNAARVGMGYRLQVLSTNDRELAMKTRTQLLQKYPDEKVYMLYQAPYIKLEFGNFINKQDAEKYKNQISRMMNGASVYVVPKRIEVKPDKGTTEENN